MYLLLLCQMCDMEYENGECQVQINNYEFQTKVVQLKGCFFIHKDLCICFFLYFQRIMFVFWQKINNPHRSKNEYFCNNFTFNLRTFNWPQVSLIFRRIWSDAFLAGYLKSGVFFMPLIQYPRDFLCCLILSSILLDIQCWPNIRQINRLLW